MHITLIPQRRDDRLRLEKQGETLVINDEPFDLSVIPDGATLPRAAVHCDWLVSDIERRDGTLYLSLILPHGACAPQETLFPATRHNRLSHRRTGKPFCKKALARKNLCSHQRWQTFCYTTTKYKSRCLCAR